MIILVVGLVLMGFAPLLRRFGAAWQALALGATMSLSVAVIGLVLVDPRIGEGAIESNRREYLYVAACSLPTLILAIASRRRFKWAFWVAWAISLVFISSVLVVVIWLEFFWHW